MSRKHTWRSASGLSRWDLRSRRLTSELQWQSFTYICFPTLSVSAERSYRQQITVSNSQLKGERKHSDAPLQWRSSLPVRQKRRMRPELSPIVIIWQRQPFRRFVMTWKATTESSCVCCRTKATLSLLFFFFLPHARALKMSSASGLQTDDARWEESETDGIDTERVGELSWRSSFSTWSELGATPHKFAFYHAAIAEYRPCSSRMGAAGVQGWETILPVTRWHSVFSVLFFKNTQRKPALSI